jgi:hypothetical protein
MIFQISRHNNNNNGIYLGVGWLALQRRAG